MRCVTNEPLHTEPLQFSLFRIPFFLEPDYSHNPNFFESNHDRLIRKWGGVKEFNAQKHRHTLKERGKAAGIAHFNLQRTASSTYLSHRLVQYVTKTYSITESEALYTELNYNHFVLGQKLNDMEMLLTSASKTIKTFDRKAAQLYLQDTKAGTKELRQVQLQLNELGIHSIPAFIIGGEFMMNGAADEKEFIKVFRDIEKDKKEMNGNLFGKTLGFSNKVLNDVLDVS